VALMPTSDPHAGQICGRGWLFPPPENPKALFQRSRRRCHS